MPGEVIITAILLGLSAGISPGPLFALIVSDTLRFGKKAGIKIAIAPLITDSPIILMIWMLSAYVPDINKISGIISIIGGIYLLYLGYESFMDVPESTGPVTNSNSLRKGILVNLLNPNPYLFWFSVWMPMLIKSSAISGFFPILFLAIFYFLLISTKILLVILVNRIDGLIKSKFYLIIIHVFGILLIILGIRFILNGVTTLL